MTEYIDSLARALPNIAQGILITLQLTVGGALLAFALSLVLGFMARSKRIFIRGVARTVIEFFRGTSLVVQLFFFFFVLPIFGFELPALMAGILGLGLNYGAYGAEVVRGSLNSVPTAQWEATVALSLSPVKSMWRIIFPQAWAIMIPSLNNLLIQLLKGTAIVSFITLVDLTVELNKLRVDTDVFFAYSLGLIIYFLLAYAFTLVMNALEVRAKHKLGQGQSLRESLSFRTPRGADV